MELVNRFKEKSDSPKLRETRLGVFSFICALVTLAYLNMVIINDLESTSNLFVKIFPIMGIFSALLSFTRVKYKKTFALWALALYLFMIVFFIVVFFFAFIINTKP